MAEGDPVLRSRPKPDIVLLQLSRPKARNALNGQMINFLIQYLDEASTDSSCRAVVVTGDPAGKAFCAGADLSPDTSSFAGGEKAPRKKVTIGEYRDGGGLSSLAALNCTKPIIAAINGAAVGWGLAFTLAADMRVCAKDAKVGFTMAARGLVNESISSYLLPRLVGAGKAKELVFTSRVFTAEESLTMCPGLFNYVLPAEEVVSKAMSLAEEIAGNSSGLSVAMCKNLMDSNWNATPEEAMLKESWSLYHVNHVKTGDLKEGMKAFLEKRPAKWAHDAWEDLPDWMQMKTAFAVTTSSRGGGAGTGYGPAGPPPKSKL